MSKFIIYEYNKQNKDLIVEELEADGYGFISIPLTDNITIKTEDHPNAKNGLLIDISMVVWYFKPSAKSLLMKTQILILSKRPTTWKTNSFEYLIFCEPQLFKLIKYVKEIEIK